MCAGAEWPCGNMLEKESIGKLVENIVGVLFESY
jgi:hypothetical protein